MNLLLQRYLFTAQLTRGTLLVDLEIETSAPFQTLELPWRDDKSDVSCVPEGDYTLYPFLSPTHGLVWRLNNPSLGVYGTGMVPEGARFGIEIHAGNTFGDTLGCILVGLTGTQTQVLESDQAMIDLRAVLGGSTQHTLTITRAP